MPDLHEAIVDVLADDEEPLGVVYHDVEKRLGRELHALEYVDAINHLLENDVIRLWETDVPSGDRAEVFLLTVDRALLYLTDEGFDVTPFLTLARGPLAKDLPPPAWHGHVNAKEGRFVLEAGVEAEAEAMRRMHDTNPEFRLRVERRDVVGKRVRVTGSAELKDAPG
jgi:hypothetical protein